MAALVALSGGTTVLLASTALAVSAVAYVLVPLLSPTAHANALRNDRASQAPPRRDGIAAAAAAGISDGDIEAMIQRAGDNRPTCSDCGVRPEHDAVYCSNCGRYLPAACNTCGAQINEPASTFCHKCGVQLAPTA